MSLHIDTDIEQDQEYFVKFEDEDTSQEIPRLIMEFMPAGNLTDHVNEDKTFSFEEIARILVQGVNGLAFLYKQGFVHM